MEHDPFGSILYLVKIGDSLCSHITSKSSKRVRDSHTLPTSSLCARTDHILVAAVIEDLCQAQPIPRKWTQRMSK